MRSRFPGHYKLSKTQLDDLWNDSIFVFDTNVLLHFYRYSPDTAHTLVRVCEKLHDRIYIPPQVADEFFKNRLKVISDQVKAYAEGIKQVNELKSTFESQRSHPFLSSKLASRIAVVLLEAEKELSEGQGHQSDKLQDDPVLADFARLFGHCIGKECTKEEAQRYRELAKARLSEKLPPGYCDSKKDDADAHGDAILWLQTLEMATTEKRNVIFVTDDTKDDWWLTARGKTQGPRPELVKEFVRTTGQEFHMYLPSPFLEFATERYGLGESKKAVKEAKRITASRRSERERLLRSRAARQSLSEEAEHVHHILEHISIHFDECDRFLSLLRKVSKEDWEILEHPFGFPSSLYDRIQSVIHDCPCIFTIIDAVQETTPPAWHQAMSELERVHPVRYLSLAVEFRRIPKSAIELIQTMKSNADD